MNVWKGIYGLIWRLLACVIIYLLFVNLTFTVQYNSEKGINLILKNIAWIAKQGIKIIK